MANFTTIQSSLGTSEFTTGTERSIVKAATFSSGSPQLTQGYVRYTIDATGLPAGAVIEVRRYLTAGPSGTQRQVDIATIRSAQVIEVDMGLVVEPWDVTIKLIAGSSPQTIGYVVKQDINQVSITDGAIAAATFAAGAITSTVLAANAITSTIIASGAIGASQIASAAITAAKFATDAIDGNALAAAAVTKIQSGLALVTDIATIIGRLPTALIGGRMQSDVGSWLGTQPVTPTVAGIPKVEDATMQARIDATRAAKIDQLDAAMTSRASLTSVASVQTDTTALRASVDVAVSSRAPATDMTTLLGRLTSTRAGLLDNLAQLDVAASSIAGAVWSAISEGTEAFGDAIRLLVARAAGGDSVSDGDGHYTFKSRDRAKTRIDLQRAGNTITVVTRDGT